MGQAKALKNFQDSERNVFVTRGTELNLDDTRHRALANNGLVTLLEEEKKAPEPSNKMAADPQNKAITHDTMRDKRVPLTDPQAADRIVQQAGADKVAMNDPNAAAKVAESARPLPLTGGETGAGTASSSSQPGRQQSTRRSTQRRDEQK